MSRTSTNPYILRLPYNTTWTNNLKSNNTFKDNQTYLFFFYYFQNLMNFQQRKEVWNKHSLKQAFLFFYKKRLLQPKRIRRFYRQFKKLEQTTKSFSTKKQRYFWLFILRHFTTKSYKDFHELSYKLLKGSTRLNLSVSNLQYKWFLFKRKKVVFSLLTKILSDKNSKKLDNKLLLNLFIKFLILKDKKSLNVEKDLERGERRKGADFNLIDYYFSPLGSKDWLKQKLKSSWLNRKLLPLKGRLLPKRLKSGKPGFIARGKKIKSYHPSMKKDGSNIKPLRLYYKTSYDTFKFHLVKLNYSPKLLQVYLSYSYIYPFRDINSFESLRAPLFQGKDKFKKESSPKLVSTLAGLKRGKLTKKKISSNLLKRFKYLYLSPSRNKAQKGFLTGIKMRLKILLINIFLENQLSRFFRVPVRVWNKNLSKLHNYLPNHWYFERNLSYFLPQKSWEKYLNYIYILSTLNLALLKGNATLVANLVAFEVEKSYQHTKVLKLISYILQSLLVNNLLIKSRRGEHSNSKGNLKGFLDNLHLKLYHNIISLKIILKGCFNKRKRKSKARFLIGPSLSPQTLDYKCHYAFSEAITKRGSLGVHVFMFYH